jgi:hypothetical protein
MQSTAQQCHQAHGRSSERAMPMLRRPRIRKRAWRRLGDDLESVGLALWSRDPSDFPGSFHVVVAQENRSFRRGRTPSSQRSGVLSVGGRDGLISHSYKRRSHDHHEWCSVESPVGSPEVDESASTLAEKYHTRVCHLSRDNARRWSHWPGAVCAGGFCPKVRGVVVAPACHRLTPAPSRQRSLSVRRASGCSAAVFRSITAVNSSDSSRSSS